MFCQVFLSGGECLLVQSQVHIWLCQVANPSDQSGEFFYQRYQAQCGQAGPYRLTHDRLASQKCYSGDAEDYRPGKTG